MDTYGDAVARRRDEIERMIDSALERSGRDRSEVSLVAVSKTVGVDEVVAAMRAGYRHFAENRPQELNRKLEGLQLLASGGTELPACRFDMIGNLQTNKINAVLGRVQLIHSVSSAHLARAISERVCRQMEDGRMDAPQDVLLEVNVSGEESKGGFPAAELRASMDQLVELSGIRLRGLMTMAPRGDKEVARATFAGLRELRDALQDAYPELDLSELSCGMSEDFREAIEEGSTIVRLGRVVFDPGFALQ